MQLLVNLLQRKVSCSKFVKKNLNSIFQEYNEGIESIRIENALCDEKTKELLFNEKGEYKFSKEGLKNFIAEKKSFVKQWEAKEFEVEPYIAKKELPDMNQEQKEILEGILIEKIK